MLGRVSMLSVFGVSQALNLAAPALNVRSIRAGAIRMADDDFDGVKPSTVFSKPAARVTNSIQLRARTRAVRAALDYKYCGAFLFSVASALPLAALFSRQLCVCVCVVTLLFAWQCSPDRARR